MKKDFWTYYKDTLTDPYNDNHTWIWRKEIARSLDSRTGKPFERWQYLNYKTNEWCNWHVPIKESKFFIELSREEAFIEIL